MLRILLVLMAVQAFVATGYSQDKTILARRFATNALESLEAGDSATALKMLVKAADLDEKYFPYREEAARLAFQVENYTVAIKSCREMIRSRHREPWIYLLWGNSLETLGKAQEAEKIYKEGIRRFKTHGPMYVEIALLDWSRRSLPDALDWLEKGIKKDPWSPDLHYWAAILSKESGDRLWASVYAEVFLNLERNGPRTREMSTLLFRCFQESFKKGLYGDNRFEFLDEGVERKSNALRALDFKMQQHYNRAIRPGIDSLDLAALVQIRDSVMELAVPYGRRKPRIPLLDWMKVLENLELQVPYQYWLFFDAREREFSQWYQKHQWLYDPFEDWFRERSIRLYLSHPPTKNRYR